MNTFQQHINAEGTTIYSFIEGQPSINLKEIQNDSYSRYDFEFVSGSTVPKINSDGTRFKYLLNGLCEVKTRNSNIIDYQSEGILIELNKLTAVIRETTIKQAENINLIYQPFYLSKYNDVTYLFNLMDCDLGRIQIIRCPKTSSSNGNNEYVNKACVLLSPDDAIITINHI
ncbi:hypothetical protein AAU57_08850 [Nonlabens sp. YIK11]|uniref:hypothetical protein n=1 Tax=Nonlabens sp. YIK11 TaxID=1453349 RepID=UPI0006DC8DDC|nr:hypothetical protein [Nonlabens sp. YIK11]KQC33411.1 hypothetical protein AAU57_08850 [Nonlabens sp. YIK11]